MRGRRYRGPMAGTTPPTGLKRWLFHAPTYLYRARLGFVFGHRFLMIEHRGRRSGTRYRTVVEVAGRSSDEWFVAAGYGPGSDWYRNLVAGGLEAVWIGSRRHAATARFPDADEAARVFARYEADHPRAAKVIMDELGISYDGTDAGRVEMVRAIPMVAFSVG
jgi:deazaflavin-dependent oxidoreductase (nitroreductase family)